MAYSVTQKNADLLTVCKQLLRTAGEQIRVAVPGIIQAFNASQQTVTVQLAIKEKLTREGEVTQLTIPPLVDVPIVLPYAGDYGLFLTPKQGDECLVIFADMCIDSWWQSGGIQTQADTRRHDLSDGFVVLGCWSQPNKPTMPSEGLRIGSKSGSEYLDINNQLISLAAAKGFYAGSGTPSGTAAAPLFEIDYDTRLKQDLTVEGYATFNGGTNISLPDTGWIAVIPETGFNVVSTLYKRRIGNIVYLTGEFRYTPAIAQGAYVTMIADIGDNYTPTVTQPGIALAGDYAGFYLCVNTDGSVLLRNRSDASRTNCYFAMACSYCV